MRIRLSETDPPEAITTLTFNRNATFRTLDYIELGYTGFDVMAIGGAGGSSTWWWLLASPRWCGGGGGGGGGSHRVQGELSSLPNSVSVIVGRAGRSSSRANMSQAPLDGGYSSFNGSLCRASGGKAGTNPTPTVVGSGGEAGIGNRTTAGGGGNSQHGSWDGEIGSGGRGGAGGVLVQQNSGRLVMTQGRNGGDGSYSQGMPVAGVGGAASDPMEHTDYKFCGGSGGGATPRPLNGLSQAFGSNAPNAIADGVVVLRLIRS